MIITKCPHCEEEIDHLDYEQTAREYGTCDLDGSHLEENDAEYDGIKFFCPNCELEIDDIDEDLIEEEIEEETENNKKTTTNENNSNMIINDEYRNTRYKQEEKQFITCPKCHKKTEITNNEKNELKTIECWNCENTIKINNK